ncbi:MAG: hypothetical protein IJK97_08660, partial [Thermoguttaceae bacterium]|nr:hypothetical protein [Thermoguttaceae bacterium]
MFRFLISMIVPASTSKPTSRDLFEWYEDEIISYNGKETDIVIPEGTKSIGDDAIQWYNQLTSVVIPEG